MLFSKAMDKGLAIVRDASGVMLCCMEKPLDEKFFSAVFAYMDLARGDSASNVYSCEVWSYKAPESMSLLATFF